MRMQERHCSFNIFFCRAVDTALKFVLHQILEFGTALSIHTVRLPQFGLRQAR
jgi:hypothetical protein